VIHRGELTADGLYEELSNGIEGQDRVLEELARSVVAGLGSMAAHRKGPRGVYVLGGPSGVGKTETAVRLSRVLGGGREALIRINCNMLHGSAHDRGPAQNILLGVPPGFLGYVRGNGGELSRIRDHPQSVVLFDEIEKASSTISDLLLQIIDDGQCEDAEGNLLDFRRSFILFTTNVGSTRTAPTIGFGGPDAASGPSTDEASLRSALRAMGFHDAFLGRMDAFFVFAPLDRPAVLRILEAALRGLGSALRETGRSLETDPDVAGVLADRWQPEFGARHLTALVDRITREISVGEAAGELEGVSTVRITATRPDTTPVPELRLERRLENGILIIHAR